MRCRATHTCGRWLGQTAADVARRAHERAARRLEERTPVRRSCLVEAVLETVGLHPGCDDPLAGLGCPACRAQRVRESALVPAAVADGRPLCVPHLRVADRAGQGAATLAVARAVWGDLDAALAANVRSQDYRFRREPRGAEQRAPRTAVRWIAGKPGIR